jgi:GNAT superfamily N-acetyltransferase
MASPAGQPLTQLTGCTPVKRKLMMGKLAFAVGHTDNGLRERLDNEINAFNAAATGHTDGRLLCITVSDDGGDLRAGLFGWTWGGCGYIDLLWVRADQRGSGLGTRLLAAAEEEIARRGCGQVALSTHSFQAPGFYARFGYQECGRTPAYPHGHDHIHLVKRLTEPRPAIAQPGRVRDDVSQRGN